MKVKIITALLAVFVFLFTPSQVVAVCPVCIVAVGAGVGLSRWLGISDMITGLWLGGLMIALTVWTSELLRKRKIKFPFIKVIILLIYYFITFIPLHASKIIGHPLNRLFGIDKLLLGSIVGLDVFVLAIFFDKYLRLKNSGKVKFFYQKVIIPVITLAIVSFIFYFAKL